MEVDEEAPVVSGGVRVAAKMGVDTALGDPEDAGVKTNLVYDSSSARNGICEAWGGKKETKAMVSHQMDTKKVIDKFVAPCFVNGLEAYDGEINLGVEENMISNEYAIKLSLEQMEKRGNKVVKKELIVALRGEIYFVKFIINPEEDDMEPGVILGMSFLHLTKAITYFRAGTVIIYPEFDPFLEDIEE
ncbi:hypothetical protein Tco_0558919 [Tanacetum coccineum]